MNDTFDLAHFVGRFHPVLVHLPIGLLVLLAFMAFISCWRRFEKVDSNAGVVLTLAVPGSIAAAVCGWLLSSGGGYDPRMLQIHFWTGIATAGATTLAALFYLVNAKALYRLTVFGSFGALVVASHYGGSLTHGSDYLIRHAPGPVRSWFGGGRKAPAALPESTGQPSAPSAYAAVVHPIMENYCVSCHGPEKSKGGLRLDTYEALLKGGDAGVVVVPGKSADSELVKRILLPMDSDDHMPPDGKPQPKDDEVALLRWWIDSGASPDEPVAALPTTARISEVLKKVQTTSAPVIPAPETKEPPALERAEAVAKAAALAAELHVPVTALSETEAWLQCNASVAGKDFKDEHLGKLGPIANNLRWLDLGGTGVTDAGLAQVASMPNLVRLYLQRTEVTDEGLKSLEGLQQLDYLNLYGTRVSDAAFDSLAKVSKLRQVFLWQTQVTPSNAQAFAASRVDREQVKAWEAEIEALKKRIRDAQITVNMGIETPKVDAVAGPMNTLCPVSGKPVDKQRTSVYEGKAVAFCCADCKATFEKDPTPFLARLDLPGKVTAAVKAVNTECPVSGKPVDEACTLSHEGKLVAFCCADCRAKFETDPKAYLDKLHVAQKTECPVNAKCPLSGKDVNAACTLAYEGKLIAFCCGDCRAKFEKDPKAYLDKLKVTGTPEKPVNAKCPVSGEDVNPSCTLAHGGRLIAFCCGDCRAKFEKDPASYLPKLESAAKQE